MHCKFSAGSGTSGCESKEVGSPLEAQEGTVAARLRRCLSSDSSWAYGSS